MYRYGMNRRIKNPEGKTVPVSISIPAPMVAWLKTQAKSPSSAVTCLIRKAMAEGSPTAEQKEAAEAAVVGRAWAPFMLVRIQTWPLSVDESHQVKHANRLLRAIRRRGQATMTARDLFALVRDSAIPDRKSFDPVLALMVEYGALRPTHESEARKGRKPELYDIRPELLPDSTGGQEVADGLAI
jgi:hypothetical protein